MARVAIIPVDRNLNPTHTISMQASTLGILEAADFSPKQARALAQAIEGEIKGSNLVTVPGLDERLDLRNYVTKASFDVGITQLRLDVSEMEKRLLNSMMKFGLSLAGLTLTAIYFIVLNLKR